MFPTEAGLHCGLESIVKLQTLGREEGAEVMEKSLGGGGFRFGVG